eukprot:CAMPEP_0179122352 /NCGR_PEP_ID=MMETSP0796-20121207/57743_1 /TAXON_ID=73915 /ORGANISM="Pyrodinium bahamense, Strain pbaha01" /LENGTH=442 /DNA_ID=CAMNT_0020820975 /DNA_START=73 /DNA_END=1401 /DNA_ORIENTATION=+
MMHLIGTFLIAGSAVASPATFLQHQRQGLFHEPVLLPLSRRITQFGNASSPTYKSFYMGNIRVGIAAEVPQELMVFFDTGSGQVILDSTRCSAPACLRHRQYSPDRPGAVSVNADGLPIRRGRMDIVTIGLDSHDVDPGMVQGNFVRDMVCLGMERSKGSRAEACAELILVAATNMTAEPFLQAPFDGIVGLGLEGLSVNGEYNFFGRLWASTGLPPHFAIFVPPGDQDSRAEIAFGGHNAARLASPLRWVPVVQPEQGFWQVAIVSIGIGTEPLEICPAAGCRGIIDSSSSQLGVPAEALQQLQGSLAATGVDCDVGPELRLTLEGGVVLSLTAKDYARRKGSSCQPQLHPLLDKDRERAGRQWIYNMERRHGSLKQSSFVLGEPVLRRYYTVFDWETKRVGFGRAASAAPATRAALSTDEEQPQTEEFILMQCRSEPHQP